MVEFNKWYKILDLPKEYDNYKTTILPYSKAHTNKCRREVDKMFEAKKYLSIERDILAKGLDISSEGNKIVRQ